MSYRHWILWVPLVAVGCAHGEAPETTSGAVGEIGVFLGNAPDGINCINFKLEDQDGDVSNFQFALTSNVKVIHNLAIGAYDMTAVAYSNGLSNPIEDGDCSAVPADAAWTTESPVPVVVQEGRRSVVNLTLLPAGRITVTVHWFEPPAVIAQQQGAVGAVVANATPFGTLVAWTTAAHGGANGRVMEVGDFPGALPFVLIDAQPNPTELAFDPDANAVYVQNLVTGTTDSDGNIIPDGAIANSFGTFIGGINPGDLGFAVANHTAYWVGMPPGAGIGARQPFNIDCFPCAQSLAIGQIGANGLTAHGNRVYWGNADGSLQGMNVTDASPTTLTSIAPRAAYGASADDQFVYFIDVDPRLSISTSKIDQVPAFGGPAVTLVDGIPGGAFPIVVFDGFVYFLTTGGIIGRVSTAGGQVEIVVSGSIGGFALTSDALGHDVIYWSDRTHGGLIWRARL